jgi:uridine kinase
MLGLEDISERILEIRRRIPAKRCALIAVTGIDASGKGYLAAKLAEMLRRAGLRIANINIDGWLNLPHVRFNQTNPAEHFYLNAIRFEDTFTQLILPLRERRSLRVEMEFAEETATAYRRQAWQFEDIDIILLEGIYLLKRAFQSYYDLSFWIDCSFETALERAIDRAQEGLPAEETIKAYRTIYFPAQEIHFLRDHPRAAANAIINNDPRLPASPVF